LRFGLINSGPMGPAHNSLFLGLAVTQTAHSIEEFYFRLFDVLAPVRYLSGLVSDNLALGFWVINALIVAFVFWTYFRRVRPAARSAKAWIWAGCYSNSETELAILFSQPTPVFRAFLRRLF